MLRSFVFVLLISGLKLEEKSNFLESWSKELQREMEQGRGERAES